MILDEEGQQLVIDPGNQTGAVVARGLVAIVITHEHADHWDVPHLEALRAAHPSARIFAPAGVAAAAEGFDITVVEAGERVTAGPFRLRFFGRKHAVETMARDERKKVKQDRAKKLEQTLKPWQSF